MSLFAWLSIRSSAAPTTPPHRYNEKDNIYCWHDVKNLKFARLEFTSILSALMQTLGSLEARIWRALGLFIHSVAKALLAPPPSPAKMMVSHYCSTWPRVSGSLRARKLPAASAPEANRMGTALVMPTNEVKMLMPRTAASLQRALRKPKAVVLQEEDERESHSQQYERKSWIIEALARFKPEIDKLFDSWVTEDSKIWQKGHISGPYMWSVLREWKNM